MREKTRVQKNNLKKCKDTDIRLSREENFTQCQGVLIGNGSLLRSTDCAKLVITLRRRAEIPAAAS